MQDMEFTIENGKLYMLQTRNGKRTAAAALKIACDLVDEGMISEKKAVLHDRAHAAWTPCCIPQFDAKALKAADACGPRLWPPPPAPPAARSSSPPRTPRSGTQRGEKVVLVRLETSPEDIEGMKAAQGILTVRGGMTSHAAVVARGMGTCCVSGCGEITMDEENKQFTLGRQDLSRGRLDLSHRRLHRQHLRRRDPHRGSHHRRRLRPHHGAGPTSTAACRSAPTPIPPATPAKAASWARRASACAAPSTCSLRATASPPSAR